MSNYRKTMGQAMQEMYPINEDNIDLMRKAAGGAAQTVKMKDGKLKMDSFTASAIMQVLDKVNPANKKKMTDMINKGTKDGMMKLQDFAMKQIKSENDPEIEEEVDLDEASKLPSHLAKFFDKDGDLKKDAADRIAKGKEKLNIKDVTPKGYGPSEEADLDEAIPKSVAYGLIDAKTNEILEKGSKKLMMSALKKRKKQGQKTILVLTQKKVGDNFVNKEEADLDEAVKVGDKIHLGFGAKGGTGFKGTVTKIAGNMVHIKNDDGKEYKGPMKFVTGEEVDLDEGYLELTFKSKQDAEKAYNKINNEIFAAGSVPYDDMNQEGNEIQFDLDGNLNRRNQILKDLKSGGIKNFKVTANEELKEGKMSQLHQLIKDKKSAEEIAKIMKLDVKTVKTLMASHYREDVEEGAESDARRGMSKDPDFSRKDSADVDDDATDDDVKGASKNIIMQMRKAVSLRGKFDVVFGDGKKKKVDPKIAQAVQQKYNSLKKPSDKEKFQAQVAKSYKDMLKVLKAGYSEQKESILDRIDRKIKENKNG